MLTLLGSLLGFGSSFVPKILDFFKEKRDQKHELALMDKQIEAQAQIGAQRLEAVIAESESREMVARIAADAQATGIRWIDGYRASVRPTIAYMFLFLFVAIEVCLVWQLLREGVLLVDAFPTLWDDEIKAIFAAIISFYFGSRLIDRHSGRK